MAEEDVEARLAPIGVEGFDCSAEEIGALQELGDAELGGVAGGGCWRCATDHAPPCPFCVQVHGA